MECVQGHEISHFTAYIDLDISVKFADNDYDKNLKIINGGSNMGGHFIKNSSKFCINWNLI